MNKKIAVLSILLLIVISACTTYEPTGEVVTEVDQELEVGEVEDVSEVGEVEILEEEVVEEDLEELPEEEIEEEVVEEEVVEELPEEEVIGEDLPATEEQVLVFYEGDLIDLNPYVMDPDGDEVTLGFTDPFDEEGTWQTEVGDAGFYSVIVTATDNKESFVTKQIKLNVIVKNFPPEIIIDDVLEFDEGDLISLSPDIYDEDGDEVVVIYSGWMGSKNYQTTYDDAGEYEVSIRADDGKVIVGKDIKIIVNDINRIPELVLITDKKITATEGDLVEVIAEGVDPDGEEVTILYSLPLGSKGRWLTGEGEAGVYEATVTATDGVNAVSETVVIEVLKKNKPPVIESLSVSPEFIELKKPGDEVLFKVNVEASDPDGDDLEIIYSGFTDTAERVVKYGEKGGQHSVTVTVSDGEEEVSQEIWFDMNNWPCFDCMP